MAIWLAQTAWKEKMGLRFALSFSHQCSNAKCVCSQLDYYSYFSKIDN